MTKQAFDTIFLAGVRPMPEKRARFDALQVTLSALEKQRNSRIFALIDGGEQPHICSPLISSLLAYRSKKEFRAKIETLEVLLHSPGGHPNVAYAAIKFLRKHCQRLNVLVPLQAKSAATLMCLGADTVFMGEFAELGPLDVQISDAVERGATPFSPLDEFKSMEFLRDYGTEVLDFMTALIIERAGLSIKEALHEAIPALVGLMTPLYHRIDPSKVGGYRRSLAIGEDYARRLLQQRGLKDVDEIVERLVWRYPSHDFVIDMDEAANLGLPVAPLPANQEELLIEAINGVIEYEISVYGFPSPTPTKAKPQGGTRKKKRRVKAVPAAGSEADKLRAV